MVGERTRVVGWFSRFIAFFAMFLRVEHLTNTLRVSLTSFFLVAEDHFHSFPNLCCQWCFDSLYGFFAEILQVWCNSFYLHMIIGTRLLLGLLVADLSLISGIKALSFSRVWWSTVLFYTYLTKWDFTTSSFLE